MQCTIPAHFHARQVPLLRKAPAPETWCVNCEASFLDGERLPGSRSNDDSGPRQQAQQQHQYPLFPDAPERSHSGGSATGGDAVDDPTADPRLCVQAYRQN